VDDFGLHAGINQAALRLAAMGHVQAIGCLVGCMVEGTAWPGWSRLLRRLEPHQVDLGLHLDLTESPLLLRPFQPLTRLIRDSFLHRLDRKALRAEIRAQLDSFEQVVGRMPAFIDGHQHVHQFPVVRSELLEELGDRYGWSKPWLRSTRRARNTWADQRPARRDLVKPWVIEQLGARGLASMARRLGYPQNARLLGVYDFRGGPQRYQQFLAVCLSAARNGDLLMCHPSLPDHANDPLIEARHAEFQVLSDPAFTVQLRDAGIDVWPMSRILGGGIALGSVPLR
jgi:chitin disaccharide deacetylase